MYDYEVPNCLKNEDHWKQNDESDRFQEYMEDWARPGNTESPIYDLERIKRIPVSMFVGYNDDVCSAPVAFKESFKVQTLKNYYIFRGADHGLATNNEADFFDLLKKEVTTESC